MGRLRLALSRRRAGDPIVNGFTRTARGVLTESGPVLGGAGPGSNQASFIPLPGTRFTSSGTVESIVTQLFDDLGSDHVLAGIAFADPPNIVLYHGTALVPSSAELWVNGVKIAQNNVTAGAKRFKLALDPGRLRAWVDGALIYDGTPAGLPPAAVAQLYIQTDNNLHPHASTAFWNSTKVTTGNALLFRRCPSSGSVVVNVNGGADQVINLDVLGAGALDLGGSSQPVKARYRVYDSPAAAGNLLADLTVPYAYGGDVLGLLAVPLTPTTAGAFTMARSASGLLFRDDFARADGAPGASYVIENGAWAIVGGKLVATVTSGVATIMRLAALAARVNQHVQLDVAKSDLHVTAYPIARRNGTTWYQFDVGASVDGTDPNKTRLYRTTAGAGVRLNGGQLPGIVVNVAERITLSVLGATQNGWVDGANLTTAADNTAANQVAGGLAFQTFGNAGGGNATLDNLVVCADRLIGAMRLPIGYKIRVGALVSAASVNGDVTLDLAGTSLPAAGVDVLDGANNVVQTVTPADGVWGGDLYLCR